MRRLNFCIIGAAGYIALRHLHAISTLEHNVLLSYDPNDNVGILDRYFPNSLFFNDTATTEIYTLSLHDALPIYKKSILRRLKFWDDDEAVKENSQIIKISKEDYEDQEKDQSLLSRLKFWDDDQIGRAHV